MHKRLPAALGAVVLSAGLLAAGRAESPASLAAKLTRAAAGVDSFVVELHVPGATGTSGTLTFVRPMRVKSDVAAGGVTVQTYLIDGTVYIHSPYAGWQKTAVDGLQAPPESLDIAQGLESAHLTILPDRDENGRRLGAFAADIPPSVPAAQTAAATDAVTGAASSSVAPQPSPTPAGSQHVECTYDKVTYRLVVCSTNAMTMTYEQYNDPSNVVELPADAASAVPIVVPSALPADAASSSPQTAPPRQR